MSLLSHINEQIEAARADLGAYRPETIDWPARCLALAESIVPWLQETAHGLKSYVEDVLNAPTNLRKIWGAMGPTIDLPKEQLEAFDRLLALDDVLRESVTGEVVSNVVSRYLIEQHPRSALASNGQSNFPDLYQKTNDYSALPLFKRKKKTTAEDEYGAAVKGKEKRPVRIPDGLEIKTCRKRIAVDCHHPHAGLHLVLVFTDLSRRFTVTDLRIAFLHAADYREAERNTTATTPKYSFNGDRFISLLETK